MFGRNAGMPVTQMLQLSMGPLGKITAAAAATAFTVRQEQDWWCSSSHGPPLRLLLRRQPVRLGFEGVIRQTGIKGQARDRFQVTPRYHVLLQGSFVGGRTVRNDKTGKI